VEKGQEMNDLNKTIYISTEVGVGGHEPGVDGEVTNPVHNYEDAKKLAEHFEKHGISAKIKNTGDTECEQHHNT